MIGIKPVETSPWLLLRPLVHGAGPEPALGRHLAIVESVGRDIWLGMMQEGQFAASQVEEVEAGSHGDDETASLAQADAAHGRWQLPVALVAGGSVPAINLPLRDIHPVEGTLARRP